MTDETMEQIKRDAEQFVKGLCGIDRAAKGWIREAHGVGATHQHPIAYSQGLAEGRRQAVEEAVRLALSHQGHFGTRVDVQDFIKKLEKLKQ